MSRATRAILAALALLAVTACGGRTNDKPTIVTIGGDKVTAAALVGAHTALCGARVSATTDPAAARAAYFDRAHELLHTVARGLEAIDRTAATDLLQAKEKVESGLSARPPTLSADIAQLAEVYRTSLGRLAISTPPCEK